MPTDSQIVEGAAELDESMITGESKPLPKGAGSKVVVGTVATDSALRVKVTAVGEETALAGIRRLVEDRLAHGRYSESVAPGLSLLGGESVSVAMVAAVFDEHCATMTTMADAHESTLVLVLDLAGTFAFGLSGGLAAVRARLDLYGVIVLAGVVGLVGGIVRDVLLGALPPATFSDWRYLATVAAAGLVAFFAGPTLERLYGPLNAVDAAGLSLFCVTGAMKGLDFGVGPVQAVLLGVITATGGGMLRDVLVREVPTVLRRELYAVPALIGATIVVVASVLDHRGAAVAIAGAMVCFLIRMVGLRFGLGLPTAPSERDKPDG